MLEIILLIIVAAWLLYLALQNGVDALRRWIVLPTVIFMAFVLLIGIRANPFETLMPMFGIVRSDFGHTTQANPDIAHYTQLGLQDKLAATNNTVLHYSIPDNKLYGNGYIQVWANLFQHSTDSTPEAGMCNGIVFSTLVYGVGAPSEQPIIISAVRDCIAAAVARHRTYFIVTDPSSVVHLQEVFGNQAIYIY